VTSCSLWRPILESNYSDVYATRHRTSREIISHEQQQQQQASLLAIV